ncbi:MAG: hypothetical protein CHACPFDD_03477 [Phycisphaerae bacterium]|nr:hypothetical protein [Phycisphaerae bacterium]
MIARFRRILLNVGWSLATLVAGRRRARASREQAQRGDFGTQTRLMGAALNGFARDRLRGRWLRLFRSSGDDVGREPRGTPP